MDTDKPEVVELFGLTALFFNEHVEKENVPDGIYRYDLRGSDDDPGKPVAVENHVAVNHAGTILTGKPLEISEIGYLPLGDELNFTGDNMTVEEFKSKYSVSIDQEGVYLLDDSALLHLKEVETGGYDYALFDRETKKKTAEGHIHEDAAPGGLTAAKNAALKEVGLEAREVARIGITSLMSFTASDIYRRAIWEPGTLPKQDIRFIDSRYNELFRIPDGGCIRVEYPDRQFTVKCQHIDDYHTYVGNNVFHICEFAEHLERNGGKCQPEAESCAQEMGWRLSHSRYLAMKKCEEGWDYSIYNEQFNPLDGGILERPDFPINQARNEVMAKHKLEGCSMTKLSYEFITQKAEERARATKPKYRESVLGQLETMKSTSPAHKSSAPKKQRETAR